MALGKRPLRDLHFTLLNEVYGMGVSDFGKLVQNVAPKLISELVAT